MVESELWEWDFAPLVVIVTEAGGRVTQADGSPPEHGGSLVSSNGLVHDAVLRGLTG
jgi:histidinol-phosphatase